MESIFTKHNLLWLRDPHGGVEDIQLMKNAGFGIIACNVQKEIPASEWALVRSRAAACGMIVVPWCYIWNMTDMDRLVSIADDWAAPNSACIPNPEKQLDLGVFTTQQMADRLGTRDAAFSTEAWLFDNVDWSPIIKWSMMLQIFPLEVPASADWNGCKIHAHKKGFSCVTFTFGSYDVNGVQPQPSDYPLKTPYQIYTADDLTYCYPHYEWWGPTGTFQPCLTVKPPISEEDCPYTGPYYPIGSKYKPTRGKTVKALKIAMNRLGCGRFLNPSIYFGAQLKSALFRFQIASGISPTGNYGRKTWVALRAATTANGEYAFNDECLTLIQEDAVS